MTATGYRGQGLDLGGQKLTSVAAGTAATDAVNFQQLANAINGIQFKAAVLAATTTNLTLSGEQTIDGFTTSGSRVLVKNQSTASQNGIYVTASGAWTLATDANSSTAVQNGDVVTVENGTANAQTQWQLTTANPITPGTTGQTWTKLASTGTTYTAGAGITINAGTIAATGPQKYAAAVPAGSSSTAISHGLNTTDVQVIVYDISGASPVQVLVDVTVTSSTVVTLTFGTAPTTGQYRVVVIG